MTLPDGQGPTGEQGAQDPAPTEPPPDADGALAEDPASAQRLEDPAAGGDTNGPATSVEKPAAEKPAAAKTAPAERPARPAREAEPKEAPRVPPPPGSINEVIAAGVAGSVMSAYLVPTLAGDSVAVEVAPADLPAVMTLARDDERLDLKYLRCVSGVDWMEEGVEVVYHLWSFAKKHQLTVKTRVPRERPVVPSIASIFPAADWHERETRDMFGIHFEGHPDLVPLLLPEDMTDHFPLRKDNPLQEIEEWQGEYLREGAEEGEE